MLSLGDATAGACFESAQRGELGRWFGGHPELRNGDRHVLDLIDPMTKYELRRSGWGSSPLLDVGAG